MLQVQAHACLMTERQRRQEAAQAGQDLQHQMDLLHQELCDRQDRFEAAWQSLELQHETEMAEQAEHIERDLTTGEGLERLVEQYLHVRELAAVSPTAQQVRGRAFPQQGYPSVMCRRVLHARGHSFATTMVGKEPTMQSAAMVALAA